MKSPCAVNLHNGVHCISIEYLNTTRWISWSATDPKSQTTAESHPSQNEGWDTRLRAGFLEKREKGRTRVVCVTVKGQTRVKNKLHL
jgi:hypothetical protein